MLLQFHVQCRDISLCDSNLRCYSMITKLLGLLYFNTVSPKQSDRHLAVDIKECIFVNVLYCIFH